MTLFLIRDGKSVNEPMPIFNSPKLILDNLQGFATTLKRLSNSLGQFLNIWEKIAYMLWGSFGSQLNSILSD